MAGENDTNPQESYKWPNEKYHIFAAISGKLINNLSNIFLNTIQYNYE